MRSTIGQLRDFKESNIWKDMRDELGVWLNEIHGQLENAGVMLEHRSLDRLGGNAETVRNVMDILDVLIGLVDEEDSEPSTPLI
jgi:hypothetical protein